jgi:hypothetical protein
MLYAGPLRAISRQFPNRRISRSIESRARVIGVLGATPPQPRSLHSPLCEEFMLELRQFSGGRDRRKSFRFHFQGYRSGLRPLLPQPQSYRVKRSRSARQIIRNRKGKDHETQPPSISSNRPRLCRNDILFLELFRAVDAPTNHPTHRRQQAHHSERQHARRGASSVRSRKSGG